MPNVGELSSAAQLAGAVDINITSWVKNLFTAKGAWDNFTDGVSRDANGRLRDAEGRFVATGERMGAGFSGGLGKGLSGIGEKLRGVADQVGIFGQIVSGAIGAAFGKSIIAASDINESINKMSTVFGSAGQSVIDFANDSATSLGLSKAAALDAAGGFGNILVSMGLAKDKSAEMSTQMLQLAADMGSLNNVDPSLMLEKLRAGLVGEAEPLRTVGVLLSENAVKLKAQELGYKAVGGQLTEQQKVMARYAIILEQSKTAQGDFAKTSGDVANASRIVKAQFENVTAAIGQQFLPAVKSSLGFISSLLKGFDTLSPSIKTVIGSVIGITGVAAALVPIISGVAFAFGALLSPIGAVVLAIAGFVIAYRNNVAGLRDSTQDLLNGVKQFWEDHKEQIKNIAEGLWLALKSVFQAGAQIVASIMSGLGDALRGDWKSVMFDLVGITSKGAEGMLQRLAATFAASRALSFKGIGQIISNFGSPTGMITAGANIAVDTASSLTDAEKAQWEGLKAELAKQQTEIEKGIAGIGNTTETATKKVHPKLKAAGGGMGKALVDGFKDGVSGLAEAFSVIDKADLSALLEKQGKKISAAQKVTADALKIGIAAINDYATAMGVAGKLTEAQGISMEKPIRESLERNTLAYKTAQQEISRIQVEGLASQKVIFSATQDQIDHMSAGAKKSFADLGGSFRVMPPALKEMGLTVLQVTGSAADDIAKFAASANIDFTKLIADFDRVSAEAPKPFSAITIAAQSAAQKLKDALAGDETLAFVNAQLDIRSSIDSTIGTLGRYGEQMGLTGKSLDSFIETTIRSMPAFKNANQDAVNAAIEAWKKGLVTLPGIWNDVFSKVSSITKEKVGAIFGVLDSIPLKFGSTVKKVTDTINQWAAFFDKILGLISKFSNSIPSSIGDAIGKIAGIFKGTSSSVTSSLADWTAGLNQTTGKTINATNIMGSSIGKMSSGAQTAFTAASAAAGGFAASLAITANSSNKAMGLLEAGITSTIAGLVTSFATTGPIGAIVGGLSFLGGIIGLFKGKSAAQKEQERLNNEKLKADIAASAQATMNAALEGFQKALAFLDSLDQFTGPRKAKFQEFWKAMSRLMDGFVELAKKWQGENLEKDKAIADAIGSVAQGIAATPAAFDAINLSFTIPDSQFDVFFSNLDRFMDKFFARSDVWIEGTAKRAKKVADRLTSVVDLIAPFTEGLKGLLDLKEVPEAALNIFDAMLERMVQHIGALADKFDKGWLKTMAFFAEKSQAALGLWKDATDAIRATADVPRLDPSAIDTVVGNIETFITKLIASAQNINSENLAKAASIAQSILPIAAALKAWAEAAGVVRGYVAVASIVWDDINKDFNLSISLMLSMLDQAIRFIPDAIKFEDTMKTIADHLRAGLGFITEGINAAQSAFLGLVNVMSQPQNPIVGGNGLGGTSAGGSFAASSYAGLSANHLGLAPANSAGNSQPIVVNVSINGNVIHEQELKGLFLGVMLDLFRMGALNKGVIAGT